MKISPILLLLILSVAEISAQSSSDPALSAKSKELMSNKKFSGFRENKGQLKDIYGKAAPYLLFKTEAHGVALYVTESGLSYVFTKYEKDKDKNLPKEERIKIAWDKVDMLLKGASIRKENILKEGASRDFSQYFFGHCPEGVSDVRSYEKITVREVYPGIDWVLYNSTEKGFKYDFVVHPGADPNQIQLLYSSKEKININEEGAIQAHTSKGNLTENAPESFLNGKPIESKFKIISQSKNNFGGYDNLIAFEFGALVPIAIGMELGTLIVDPQLTWASFIGGTVHEGAQSITCDPAGNITIVGYLASLDFPVLNPGGGSYYQGTNLAIVTAFIINFNNAGVLLWSTYYGGSGGEEANYVTNDATGNIFVTGYTSSTNFPTQNAGGGSYYQAALGGMNDSYILKFSNTGVRQWATYYGGNDVDHGRSLNIDPVGNLLMTGFTSSTNFPVLNPGGGAYYQPTLGGGPTNAYVLKFSNSGIPIWATYLGGNVGDGGMSIATDANSNIFTVGYTRSPNFPTVNPGGGTFFQGAPTGSRNGYITKFTSAGVMTWSTYYGGNSSDVTSCVAVDGSNNVFVSGSGYSPNLSILNPGGGAYFQAAPAPGGLNELFILKFTNAGVMTWGTYFGGTGDEGFYCNDNLIVDKCDNVYLSMNTNSTNAPVLNFCPTGFNDATLTGMQDQFLAKFSNSGVQTWGTYVGGDGRDFSEALATDNSGNLFMAGEWSDVTNSATYPLTNPGGGAHFDNSWAGGIDDSYVVKFEPVASTPTATSTAAGCSCTGSATATIPAISCSGPLYTYAWSNGTTIASTTGLSSTISNLCAGTYSVVISYGACTNPDTLTYNITGSAGGFTVNITPSNATCSSTNGNATAGITGGTSPFTYSWSSGQSTSAASGLAAGNYTCVITDANGCTNTQTFSITSSGSYTVAITPVNAICSAANGSAIANITGGTSPFTYLWSNGQTTSAATSLVAGNYTCTTTDASGCTNTQTVTVSASGSFSSNITPTNISCNGGTNGIAAVAVAGGTAPYTYLWSPTAAATATATGLSAGNYTVVVTDANGCSSTQTVLITQPTAITLTTTNTPSACNGSTGTATVAAAGGSGSYTYLWNHSGASTPTATGLTAGNYSVTITDGNGCTQVAATTIVNSNGPTANSGSSVSINQGNAATLSASGGVTYAWNTGQSTAVISVTPTTTTVYCVTVTDASGCTDSACVTVFVIPEPVVCGEFYLPNAFSPNEDGENDVFNAYIDPSCVTEFKLVIYNRWGEKVFETENVAASWNGYHRNSLSNAAVYTYYCNAKLTNGKNIETKGNVSLLR